MKTDCAIIKDILPLYVEEMVSERSRQLIGEHLAECENCRRVYDNMTALDLGVRFENEPEESFRKYAGKKKRRMEWKGAVIATVVVLAAVFVRLAIIGGLAAFLAIDAAATDIETDEDVRNYQRYMGEGAEEKYRNKWEMDESIFPAEITSEMIVKDYKMVYYNPWDAQYLSYLVVEYDEETYALERKRLVDYPPTAYEGNYGALGFDEKYELLAMNADAYHGFVYALAGEENEIIYVEVIFCNYFMDIDYEEYIDMEYLPIGFDASKDNAYREKQLQNHKQM